ncbi:uncharacterized protein N7483_001506 [Penicillium malachiteum]|uniref:uncharacterized protein n=1 Tax=Penicillium malachiteum TaxID=1324776 RepID=UPI00254911B7|nr:uncharacterized protein N7483_001506 [Penicillium malachiteum]KAJ5736381.1 hypothetical protein N7483_001506 [Penicillium malachiteum]
MADEQMNQQQMEHSLAEHHQDTSGGVEESIPAPKSPKCGDKRKADWDDEPNVQTNEDQPKRLHLTRVEEISITDPARALELENLGREIVLKRDYLSRSWHNVNELDIFLRALFARLMPGDSSLNDWIMDLTVQMHQMRMQIVADAEDVRELEDTYRKAYCAALQL